MATKWKYKGGTVQEAAQRLFDAGLHPAQAFLERQLQLDTAQAGRGELTCAACHEAGDGSRCDQCVSDDPGAI